jgi:hypothetical protein
MLGLLTFAALVLPAAGFAQDTVRCSSDDMRRHYCDVGANSGIRFSRQASDARCTPGVTYGVERTRIWVDRGCRADFLVSRQNSNEPGNSSWGHNHPRGWERWGRGRDNSDYGNRGGGRTVSITCSSNDGYHSCAAEGEILSARITRQRSGSACTQGRSWGYQGSTLWVDHGCRADFELADRDGNSGGWYGRSQARGRTFKMRCDSDDEGYHTCRADGDVINARLVHQNSGSPCSAGRTWGFRRDGIWVDRGCRAEFEVTTR